MPFNTTFIAKSLIVHSESPPDTKVLWYDTVEGALKFYNKSSASWEKVVNITEEHMAITLAMCDRGGV
jgi:hypothetical protein